MSVEMIVLALLVIASLVCAAIGAYHWWKLHQLDPDGFFTGPPGLREQALRDLQAYQIARAIHDLDEDAED